VSGEENFLSRWSRRKAEEKADELPAKAAEVTAEEKAAKAHTEKLAEKAAEPAEEPLDLSTLPSIESLGKDSDYTMFMQKGVPDDLRLKAIRRMWATDPSIAGPDLLDMHAWDYTGNDGLRPLVAPAIEALAAAAKELVERSREAAKDKPSAAGESPEAKTTEVDPLDEIPPQGRG
jgi:hypothetical protein